MTLPIITKNILDKAEEGMIYYIHIEKRCDTEKKGTCSYRERPVGVRTQRKPGRLAVERPPEPRKGSRRGRGSARYPGKALEDVSKWALCAKKSGTAEVAFVS